MFGSYRKSINGLKNFKALCEERGLHNDLSEPYRELFRLHWNKCIDSCVEVLEGLEAHEIRDFELTMQSEGKIQ